MKTVRKRWTRRQALTRKVRNQAALEAEILSMGRTGGAATQAAGRAGAVPRNVGR